jgi:hypothetical protein
MVPKLHKRGTSFGGIARYVLHDKAANTNERVDWTETLNLATRNAHSAWRVMAATAMDADRLKAQANVKSTGRKSKDCVLHLTLSWHADESKNLTKEEMMRAARGAIKALKAEDFQAMVVSHRDEPQPHVHIVINRVSPKDGRLLSSSKEKLALSRWAQQYEKERGEILCEQRVINNAARDRGEFTRGEPDRARHLYEQEAGNDNSPEYDRIRQEQQNKDAEIAVPDRKRKTEQPTEAELHREYLDKAQAIRTAFKPKSTAAVDKVRREFRTDWEKLYRDQREATQRFEENEKTMAGRITNFWKSIDFGALLRSGERRQALTNVFKTMAGSGSRRELFREKLDKESRQLAQRQRAEERKTADRVRAERQEALARNHREHLAIRNERRLVTKIEAAKTRGRWRKRRKERAEAFKPAADQSQKPSQAGKVPNVRDDFTTAAAPPEQTKDREKRSGDEARELEQKMQRERESHRQRRGRGPRRGL